MVKYYILKRLYISLTDKRGEESAGMEMLIRGKQISASGNCRWMF